MADFINSYFKALEAKNYELMLSLFSDDACVHSPLYEEVNAKSFYKNLFAQTSESKIKVLETFEGNKPKTRAVHFTYEWSLKNDSSVEFECVDVFYTNDEGKITKLVIIYDAKEAREAAL